MLSSPPDLTALDPPSLLQQQFGQIDIYVFDQLLRGNIAPGMRVLDAGCGYGRNLVYMLRSGFDLSAVDADADAVHHVRQLAHSLQPALPPANIQQAQLHALPFQGDAFDGVLCSSVLHFARDEAHFDRMLQELWRVLKPGGLFFCRLGSRIGMRFPAVGNGLYRIGDGSDWFLVDEAMLLHRTAALDAVLVDPLKTTVVQDFRCMTTWVLRKRYARAQTEVLSQPNLPAAL